MANARDELVSHLMSTPVVSLDPSAEVASLLELSETLGIHHFPLVGAAGLVGVVCTCDLGEARPSQAVSEFVRQPPVTVPPDAKAHEAAARMMCQGVGSVIVADHEGVWGIITREDLALMVPELMRAVHCVSCSTRQHLRPGPGHTLVCPACSSNRPRGTV